MPDLSSFLFWRERLDAQRMNSTTHQFAECGINEAVAGDGGVEETVYNAAAGPTADYWDVVRVEIGPDGKGTYILNGKVIHEFTSFLTTTDIQHAVLMVENRSGAANTLEIDYFFAKGYRDRTDS